MNVFFEPVKLFAMMLFYFVPPGGMRLTSADPHFLLLSACVSIRENFPLILTVWQ